MPRLERKQRNVGHLLEAPLGSRNVLLADSSPIRPRDEMLEARRNPESWDRFKAGLDGTAWYLLRINQTLTHRLPGSRSNELLGGAVQEILASEPYRRLVPAGLAPAVWAAGYLERQEAHRSGLTAIGLTGIGP